ncbi:hypothetical protein WDZ92_51925, partial [Nostoc sp. NIES-2111]
MTASEIVQAISAALGGLGGIAGLLALADRMSAGRPRVWFDCVDVSGFGRSQFVLTIKNPADHEIVVDQIVFSRDGVDW